tara:strand:+ start:106 stop:648 length:543 start_codon:yes stop_codon:yes gene_type:complete
MKINNLIRTWKQVFSKPKSILVFLISSILFYSLNVLILNFSNLKNNFSTLGSLGTLQLFLNLAIGFKSSVSLMSFLTIIIISILFGILLSLMVYKSSLNMKLDKSRNGFLSGIAIFFAALVPGCAACGIGLISIFGLGSAFITFLPYDGLEFSIAAIFLMAFAIIKTTNTLYSCSVKNLD